MSVDGYIDDTAARRLILSNAQDLDRVDEVRASCDAILVGANTIRRDNPRLLVSSGSRRARRIADGLPEYPLKVTITAHGVDPGLKFFSTGGGKLVYCPETAIAEIRDRLGSAATVAGMADPVDFGAVLDDLARRGIRRLMVEGGGQVHTEFLARDLADEIHLTIAPFFVGEPGAPRFVNAARFPQGSQQRMTLAEVRRIGDVVLLRYFTRRGERP